MRRLSELRSRDDGRWQGAHDPRSLRRQRFRADRQEGPWSALHPGAAPQLSAPLMPSEQEIAMKNQRPIVKISRRDLLRAGSSGLGLLALGSMLQLRLADRARGAAVPGLKRLVIVNLQGGNDGLNTLVPLQLGRYYDRRPSIAIAPSMALPLTGGPGTSAYGLHPKLPALQSLWNAGKVAFINKVGYPRPDLSHFTSEDIWSYGMRLPDGTNPSGWIARFADRYTSSALGVVCVGMGWRKDFSGGRVRPFIVDHLDRFQLDVDSKYALNHTL